MRRVSGRVRAGPVRETAGAWRPSKYSYSRISIAAGSLRLLPARNAFDYGCRAKPADRFLSLALPAFVTIVAGVLLE
jgi:hypothetical protein